MSEISTFQLRRRTPGSFLLVPCPQIGRSLRCQGQLEAATAIILAGCPLVKCVQEQPMNIWYAWRETPSENQIQLLDHPPLKAQQRRKDVRYSYVVPDFLVEMQSGAKHLIEVKPSSRIKNAKVHRKLTVASRFANGQGWSYHVVTERMLPTKPLLSNLRLLSRYRRFAADEAILAKIQNHVPTTGVAIEQLAGDVETACEPMIARIHIFHCLAIGELSFDPTGQLLTDKTLVFPKGVILWDPFDSLWASSSYSTGGPIEWSASSAMTALSAKIQSSK